MNKFDFNKKLMMIDNSDISFSKSLNTLNQSNKKALDSNIYDFDNCKFGDEVYYNDQYGYNLLEGDYVGFCCVEAGLLDDNPRFMYKDDIGLYKWNDAIEKCKEILNGYLPDKNELKLAFDNGFDFNDNNDYWTSSLYEYDPRVSYRIRTEGYIYIEDPNDFLNVRPFIRIHQPENYITESFDFNKELLSFDNNEIEFSKSLNTLDRANKIAIDRLYDFMSCNVGDIIYHDQDFGLNLYKGELFGYCAVAAGEIDDMPRFVYKTSIGIISEWKGHEAEKLAIRFGVSSPFYLPSAKEAMVFIYNIANNNFMGLTDYAIYWTRTAADHNRAWCFCKKYKMLMLSKSDNNSILPFFKIPRLEKNKINEMFNFNKELITFDDNEIEFSKSLNTLNQSNKKALDLMFDFQNCKFGDKVYYNDQYGYNLLEGDYAGICCIETGLLDNKPRFVYKEDIGKYNWKGATEKCKEISNGYLPSKDELFIAYNNGLKKELKTDINKNIWYWTSTLLHTDRAYVFSTLNATIGTDDKDDIMLVRPFFYITKPEKKLSESFDFNSALLSMEDDNEISFGKSNIAKETLKKVNNANDIIKYAATDIKCAISQFTGLYDLPYVTTEVKQENDLAPLELYITNKSLDVINIILLDSYLLQCGWKTVSSKEWYMLEAEDKRYKVINTLLKAQPLFEELFMNDSTSGSAILSTNIYLSPDYGIAGLYSTAKDNKFIKFILTNEVAYPNCIGEVPFKKEIDMFKNKVLKQIVTKKTFDKYLSNIVINTLNDGVPFVAYSLSKKSSKVPEFLLPILTDIEISKKTLTCDPNELSWYPSYKAKYMFNGETIDEAWIIPSLNIFILYSHIMNNLLSYRFILRINQIEKR